MLPHDQPRPLERRAAGFAARVAPRVDFAAGALRATGFDFARLGRLGAAFLVGRGDFATGGFPYLLMRDPERSSQNKSFSYVYYTTRIGAFLALFLKLGCILRNF
jgi:hypothetical protein